MANVFTIPSCIVAGQGALELASDRVKSLGKKALIVTDVMMVKLGNVKKLTDVLDGIGVGYEIYDGINGEPNHQMIEAGVTRYTGSGCDFLVAIGGGSPIDSMKAIAAVAANGGSIREYVGKSLDRPLPPICAIPTTAGTGSEATSVTIIANMDTNVKMMIKSPALMASLAIVDPQFTRTAPPAVTAATGVDALCHCVEAYTSRLAYSMSDTYAMSALKRIYKNLYTAYSDGNNIEAREQMAIGALEAGISFSNSSVTIVHGMSRPIGALFHVAHGLSNAMLLDACLHYAVSGAYDRFCDLSRVIGVYQDGMSEQEGAMAFVTAIRNLLVKLDIPTPEAYGLDREKFFASLDKMATDALASGSPANTRRQPTKEDLIELYKSLWA